MDAILIDYGITAKKTVKMEIFVIFLSFIHQTG